MRRTHLEVTSLEGRAFMSAMAAHLPPALRPAAEVASARGGHEAPPQDLALKATLEGIRARNGVPALAAGVIRDGRLVAIAVTGAREAGKSVQVEADDQFHLGSNGKAMTSTLAGILVDRGYLRWDSTIGEVFPELRGRIQPAYRGVTLEQLLNHRSGLGDVGNDDLTERILQFNGPPSVGRAIFLRPLLNEPPIGPAGEFSYSNVGYTVAGAMMERVTGRTFESLMEKLVFRPLGMVSAGFGPPGRGHHWLDQPRGHDASGKPVGTGKGGDLPSIISPAGLMHMSMADWSKFLNYHMGNAPRWVQLLRPETLAKLHTPDPRPTNPDGDRYGFGWGVVQTPMGDAWFHTGDNLSWYSSYLVIPSRGLAVFGGTNQSGPQGERAIQELVATLPREFRQ